MGPLLDVERLYHIASRRLTLVLPCIQEGDLRVEVHMNADAQRRAELRAAAIAVTFFILCAVAAFYC